MLIRVGYEIGIECEAPTPMTMHLSTEHARRGDVRRESGPHSAPATTIERYRDSFGNDCMRCLVPQGPFHIRYDAVVEVSGLPDPVDRAAAEIPVDRLPPEVLQFLLPSRYCETEYLADIAWREFGSVAPGWARVQAVCDYVHDRLFFSYGYARATRTACQAHEERVGVCRDFAHLAITLCRCLNIPARYVNGYLGDIGVEPSPAPMDFNAWFEVFLGGRWHIFDARHNLRRIGRITVARGRDAADIPMIHTFGQHRLDTFNVWTYEVRDRAAETEQVSQMHSLIRPWHSAHWARHSRHHGAARIHER